MKRTSFIEIDGKEKKRLIQYLDIKISLQCRGTNDQSTEQLLENVDITKCMNENYDSILFTKLLKTLHAEYNIPLQNREIFYYFAEGDLFINCGIEPISQEIKIDLKQIDIDNYLHIKIKDLGLSHIERLMLNQTVLSNTEIERQEASDDQVEIKGKKQCRRTKERRIGHIIEKVIEWRKFYSGTIEQARQTQKYSLDEAAKKVGISKKSLDDYLFQIRFGFRWGFNFNEHYNQKVGILRDFVRQQKKIMNKSEAKSKKKKLKEGQLIE